MTTKKPSTPSSPTIVPTASVHRSERLRRRHRCLLWCCSLCGGLAFALGLTVLVLSLTLFKIRDPTLTLNSLAVTRFIVELDTADGRPASTNMTLRADVSLKNPNAASFEFSNSTTYFYHNGEAVGVAYTTGGEAAARRTERMVATVDVMTDRLVRRIPPMVFFAGGAEVELQSFTNVTGEVSLVGVYRHRLEVVMRCNMSLVLSATRHDVVSKYCAATVS